jgi:hypothetical protein
MSTTFLRNLSPFSHLLSVVSPATISVTTLPEDLLYAHEGGNIHLQVTW